MAVKEEKYGERDLCFSGWHRYQLHEKLNYIDLDCIEYCHRCNTPLALIELAQDVGQIFKSTTVTKALAKMAGIPAYLVFYVGNDKIKKGARVTRLRTRMIAPIKREEIILTPAQYELFLVLLRSQHTCAPDIDSIPLSWWQLRYSHNDIQLIQEHLL